MRILQAMGLPRRIIEDCIRNQDAVELTDKERQLVLKYAWLDSKLVYPIDLILFSSDERLRKEEDRKIRHYRFFVALADAYGGSLPYAAKMVLFSSPCGYQQYLALQTRLESHP